MAVFSLRHARIRIRVAEDLLLRVGVVVRIRIAIGLGIAGAAVVSVAGSGSVVAFVVAVGIAAVDFSAPFWRTFFFVFFRVRIFSSVGRLNFGLKVDKR